VGKTAEIAKLQGELPVLKAAVDDANKSVATKQAEIVMLNLGGCLTALGQESDKNKDGADAANSGQLLVEDHYS
jgi:hypothetical protein